jgi:small subunit ribosomal protein S12
MPTINQLIRNPRVPKKRKIRKLDLKENYNSLKGTHSFSNNPQKSGICRKVGIIKPKKPNSAKRSFAHVQLSNQRRVTVYIPGEKHNFQEYSSVLIHGRRAQDLPGVKYRAIRGCGDDKEGVKDRRQGRSLYGAKKPK